MRLNKKIFFALGLVSLVSTSLLFSDSAKAITQTFPRDGDWAFLSKYAPGHLLETPEANFRVFYKWEDVKNRSTPLDVKVTWICRTSAGNIDVKIKLVQTNNEKSPNSCTFNNTYDFEYSFNKNKLVENESRYTDKWRYIDITARTKNVNSTIGIKVKSLNGGGKATFEELGTDIGPIPYGGINNTINNYRNKISVPGTAFALWADVPEYRDISLDFKPSCDYLSNTVFIRWYDADQGEPNQPRTLRFKVTNKRTGNTVINTTNLGGDDVYKEKVMNLTKNPSTGDWDSYEWKWIDVNDANGIQFWMPFSEIGQQVDCNKPPKGDIGTVNCGNIRLRGWDQDNPGNKAHFRLRLNSKSGPVLLNSNDSGTPRVGMSYQTYINLRSPYNDFPNVFGDGTSNKKFVLEVKDNQRGGWTKVDEWEGRKCGVPPDDLSCDRVHLRSDRFHNNSRQRVQVWIRNTPFSGNPGKNNNDHQFNLVREKNSGHLNLWLKDALRKSFFNRKGNIHKFIRIYNGSGENSGTHRTISRSASNCYNATCTVAAQDHFTGNYSSNAAVKAGRNVNVRFSITNQGSNNLKPTFDEGGRLSITETASSTRRHINQTVGHSGGTRTRTLFTTITAPSNITTRNLSSVPQYVGKFNLGPTCPGFIRSYQHFDINPTASISMDDEDPDVIEYTTGGNNNEANVSLSWTRILYKNTTSNILEGPALRTDTFGNVNFPDSFGTAGVPLVSGTLSLGDEVCARATVNIGSGWVGPGNDILDRTAARSIDSTCETITNKPYVQAYGADVVAGSSFGESCSLGTGEIKGYQSVNRVDKTGSGVQFAALAMGGLPVDRFRSAMLRSVDPSPLKGLTLSNSDAVGPYGGNYQGVKHCTTDYFGTTQDEPVDRSSPSGSLDISGLPDEEQSILQGPVAISSSTGTFDKSHTVYVEGNVRINSNIEYLGLGPSLTLVVKGDIYIENGVNNLDGLYVAQPDNGSGGIIYTCSKPGLFEAYPTGDGSLWNNCQSQLTVNGAFIAQDISFQRTANSLRDSCNGEYANNTPAYIPCALTNASEIFNFSPELYLNSSIFGGESSNRYDHITTLPPIL